MELGNEKWKWALVVILSIIFFITARQAYVSVFCQEEYPPPDDYKLGDSWDIEHGLGPGAGQPLEVEISETNASKTSKGNISYDTDSNQHIIKYNNINIKNDAAISDITEEELTKISNPAANE